jgi:crossover junction endodeoxyribonuclease RuvC
MRPMRLIGLDPGLRHTGWGVIDVEGNRLIPIAAGAVHSRGEEATSQRLASLFAQLEAVLDEWEPHEAAVEETFVNKNPTSTLKLGLARGIVLLAPARRGIAVAEYSANAVKKAVVGVGHAEKAQIEMMVRRLLPGIDASKDAADALAVAICHAHHRTTLSRWEGRGEPSSRAGSLLQRAAAAKPTPLQTERARELRANSTDVERKLWAQLRAKRFEGHKFRRQEPLLGFTVDFVCHEKRLVIELDGGQHNDNPDADTRRAKLLNQAGFNVIRFWNNDITENIDGVVDRIRQALELRP